MNSTTFCDLFCEAYNCLPEEFNETLLWLCLFPHALFLARWLWRWNRNYFNPDLALITRLKDLTDADEVKTEIQDSHYRYPPTGLFRGVLKVRLSGQRVLGIANGLFPKTV